MSTGVAVLGCGVIGSAVCQLLRQESRHLRERSGQAVELRHVIELDEKKTQAAGIPARLVSRELETALGDAKTQIIVELIGGLEPARTFVLKALKAGKHVVTANKHLLAVHGQEILAAAKRAERAVCFEASCGGAIPIILALTKGLVANDISRIVGIVNGTCNYILTEMTQHGQSYADALKDAQTAGYAEANPTLDVSGGDSAHKLAILAALAFGAEIPLEQVEVTGIDQLQDVDLKLGQELGYVCKLLAIGEKSDGGISLRVHPTFVPADQLIAHVHGPFNAISVYGHASGQTSYYGRGAGARPTASAVVADIIDIAGGTAEQLFAQLPLLTHRKKTKIVASAQIVSRNYLRIMVLDVPGVMAQITAIFGRHKISLAAITQHESKAGQHVPVVIMTHEAKGGAVAKAVAEVDRLKAVAGKTVRIRVLG